MGQPHRLNQPIGEDVQSLHVRLIKEKHPHFTNIAFGVVGNCRGCTCKFRLIVKWDMLLGFYVELKHKAGHAIHSSHPKLLDITYLPLSTRLLTPHQIEDALHVVNSTSNNGSARNYLHGRFGKFVNLINVAYLGRKAKWKIDSTKDEIDIMMGDFVNSDEISLIFLSDIRGCIDKKIKNKMSKIKIW